MRALASSSFSVEGMLLVTLTSRRAPQKPAVMVTACTGMLRSLAYGDLSTNRTPSSFQDELDASGLCGFAGVRNLSTGIAVIAAAEIAEPTNSRREICGCCVISISHT